MDEEKEISIGNSEFKVENKKTNEKSIAIVLIILVFSLSFVVGYIFFSNQDKEYTYSSPMGNFLFNLDRKIGGIDAHILNLKVSRTTFVEGPDTWEYKIPFDYGPEDLESIPVEDVRQLIRDSDELYLTRDVYLDLKTQSRIVVAMMTVERITGKEMLKYPIYNIQTNLASIEDNARTKELELPIITCEDADENTTVIWFKEGDENRIYKQGDYCVMAEFKENDDPIKVGTKLSYHILGVM